MKKIIKNILGAIGTILICECAGVIGSFFTFQAIPTWYTTLQKSSLNPPNFIFGPVWTLLYALMGIAVFLIWRTKKELSSARYALYIFALQLFLNTLWSIIFFGFHSPLGALIDITFLWIVVLLTIILFFRISKVAGWLLVPYLLWISFALYLNYFIVMHTT